jgi:hypothetical protein
VLPDNAIQIAKVSGLVDALLTKASISSLTAGLATKQNTINGGSSVNVGTLSASTVSTTEGLTCGGYTTLIGGASVSGTLAAQDVVMANLTVAGRIDTNSDSSAIAAQVGNSTAYIRITNGHHIDAYQRSNNLGRNVFINYYSNSDVRVGNNTTRLGVCCNPLYTLDVAGTGNFTGVVSGLSFTSTSDARIKSEVLPASLDECLRLVQEVRPQTYRRTDLDSSRRVGYIANHWDANLTPGMRNIMGPVTDADSMMSLDYSRIVPVLHGALLSALARIEALEGKVM